MNEEKRKEITDWRVKHKQVEFHWFDYLSIYQTKECENEIIEGHL